MSTAAVVVDFGVVARISIDKSNLGAELLEKGFIDDASGTIGTVHGKVEVIKTGVAEVFE